MEAVLGVAQPLARTLGLLTSRVSTTLFDTAILESSLTTAPGDSGARYYWNAPGNAVLLDNLVGWWIIWPSLAARNGAVVHTISNLGD